jgi:hypothetical protein
VVPIPYNDVMTLKCSLFLGARRTWGKR